MLPYTQTPVCSLMPDVQRYDVMEYVKNRDIIIPALEQNYIPQGIAYWPKRNWLIISGYYKPADSYAGAPLLAVNATTGELEGAFGVADTQGKRISGHFSGIAVTDRDVILTHGSRLLKFSLEQLEFLGSTGSLIVEKEFITVIEDGGCNYSDGILWVSEHYLKESPDSESNHGLMVGYRLEDASSPVPYCVFHVPEKVQGTTITSDGMLLLSTSYGRTNESRLFVYEDPRGDTPDSHVLISGHEVPVWNLRERDIVMDITAPPMSEGCCSVDTDIYLIFESAAYYYRAFHPDNRSTDPTDRIWQISFSR